jgi:hypothetical protein
MQVLDVQQASPTPYTPAGGTYNNNPVPGAGGLPSLSGLNNRMNPMAQELQSRGRNGDSVLVHMTPAEVGGLQNLASTMGGSLSINPNTGLPEANFLKKMLPMILGAIAAPLTGGLINPMTAGLLVGAGQTALTGDIRKGLMAGLGAYGGAALGGAAGLGKIGGTAALPAAAPMSAIPGAAPMSVIPGATSAASAAGTTGTSQLATKLGIQGFAPKGAATLLSGGAPTGGMSVIPQLGAPAAKTGLAGFGQKFGQAASVGLKGAAAKYAPYAAGLGLYGGLSEAMQPSMLTPEEEEDKYKYEGPYYPKPRTFRSRTLEEMKRTGGAAFDFLEPEPSPVPRMAEGGVASLPAAGDFQAAVDFFSRNSPGAITESMYSRPSVKHVPVPRTPPAKPAEPVIPGSGGEMISTSAFNPSTNSGGGANAIDLANMYGGRMSSEIASGPPPNMSMATSLPGTTIRGTNVSGQGMMPDFRLADLYVNPVERPGTITPGVNVSGQGYMPNFRLADLRVNPVEVFKDPEEFEETKARGGEVGMDDGSFVVDARTVSEMGNGSSNAGIERLAAMGGRPVRGGGDGVSDSVPARIGGKQKARVARDEVIFSPEAVRRLGGGNHSKGTKKLYALMNKAHKARKKAGRGQDTKVAKGLGGLA